MSRTESIVSARFGKSKTRPKDPPESMSFECGKFRELAQIPRGPTRRKEPAVQKDLDPPNTQREVS